MKSTTAIKSDTASSATIGMQLLNEGADVMERLRLNGIDARDNEIVVKNMMNSINNGQQPDWQKVMGKIRDTAQSSGVATQVVVGQVADHLFDRLGPAA